MLITNMIDTRMYYIFDITVLSLSIYALFLDGGKKVISIINSSVCSEKILLLVLVKFTRSKI